MACRRFHGTAKERTMKHLCRTAMVGVAVVLLLAGTAIAQTTGRIVGKIVDSSGAALPGVTVTVTSPSLQGASTAVTDGEGNYRFPTLPPGTYMVKTTLSGFKTMEQPNVQVGLDRTVEVNLTMPVASVEETVRVEAASPVVDTTSTSIGVNAKADLFNRLPVQRDIYSIARVAPGTTEDAVGTAVYGSTGAENQYIIEGLNTTGLERGQKMKQLNFDFVQEIEVKTGGLNAEYGRMTGGILNVITKSGGNKFTGSFFGFNSGGALQNDDSTADDRPTTTTTVTNIDRKWDFGADLGGYLIRDRLWFFGAYNRTFQRNKTEVIRVLSAPGSPAIGSEVPAEINSHLFAGKVTYKLSNSQTLVGSVNGDPTKRTGNVFTVAGPPSTWLGEQKTGGTDGVISYNGVFGSRFLLKAFYGLHNETSKFEGPGKNTAQLLDQTISPNTRTGGFGGFQDSEFKRHLYKADATSFMGAHELKGGVDWEDNLSAIDRYSAGGGQLIYKLITSGGQIYYRHRYFVNDRAPGFSRTNPSTWQVAVPLTAEPGTLNNSFYVQDSWRVKSNVTINGGLRWERQNVKDRDDVSTIDLKSNWAPRIGAVWDVAGNGRSKIYGNYGRFFESIPLDINIRSFGGEVACFCYNFDPSPNALLQDPAAPRAVSLFGSPITPVDPNLKGQYVDEWLFGGEYEVARNLSVGMKVIHRRLGRVIEDFLIPSEGSYFIANPSQGIGAEMAFYDGTTVAAPKAKRTNTSIEFSARKNYSENWQLLASYVWSRLEGNYDGTFQNSTGQLDPNINSAFDYADFLVNADGRLSNERVHQIKFDGSYDVPRGVLTGLNLGVSTRWYSGLPLNAYGYSFLYSNWEYYLAPRGSLGRGPSDWEADLNASYPVRLGSARLNLVMDVFNLFNRQKATVLDERYNLIQDAECAGLPASGCNGDNGWIAQPGTVNPVGSLSNPSATATNPDYRQKGITFTQPRSIRIGVRFLW
jgi:hypothetical protein